MVSNRGEENIISKQFQFFAFLFYLTCRLKDYAINYADRIWERKMKNANLISLFSCRVMAELQVN